MKWITIIIIVNISLFPQRFPPFRFRRRLPLSCWASISRFASTFRDSKWRADLCTLFCRCLWLCCSRSWCLCWITARHRRSIAILLCNVQSLSWVFACLRSKPQSIRCIYLFAYHQRTSPLLWFWGTTSWLRKGRHRACFPFRTSSWRRQVQLGSDYFHCILT